MAKKGLPLLLCMTLLPLGGCIADIADDGWQPRRPLGKEYATFHPPVEPARGEPVESGATTQPAGADEPAGAITLRQVLALAMLHSPELAGVAWDVRIAEAKALQASLPPNPEIGFDLETFGALSAAETTLQLGQVIFLSDKLARRRQAALLQRDLAGWDYEAKRIAVLTDTTKAFVALVAAQEQVALAQEQMDVSRKVLSAAVERVRSGKTSPVEEMKGKVELGMVRIRLEQARLASQGARKRLAAMWGHTEAKFTEAQGELEDAGDIPTTGQLAALVAQNPEVARWATEMQLRQAVAKLEKARAIPDLNLGAGGKRDGESGRRGWVGGVSIEIPIFDRNQGGIRESKYNLARTDADRRAAGARVHSQLAEAYQVLATAHVQLTILKNDVLPEAQKAFDASREGYQQGKFPYLDVLDAQRTLFEARSQYLAALADYHTAAASVEGLIGQSLESVATSGKQEK